MEFRSKGLGRRTVAMRLSGATTVKSGDKLYLSGTMDEPMTWDYIVVLDNDDLVDFVGLLGERTFAEYLWRSPDRWKLYATLVRRGGAFVVALLAGIVRRRRGAPAPVEPTIEVPPPRDRTKRATVSRRRLGARRDAARSDAATDTPDAAPVVAPVDRAASI